MHPAFWDSYSFFLDYICLSSKYDGFMIRLYLKAPKKELLTEPLS